MIACRAWSIRLVVCGGALLTGCAPLASLLGGASSRDPATMASTLSPEARALVERAYADVDPARLFDYHVHLVGTGEGGSGCYVNEAMLNWRSPMRRARVSRDGICCCA